MDREKMKANLGNMKNNIRLPRVPSYVKNVVKSFGYAAENKLKALAPSTAEFATTNSELYKSTIQVVRDYKTTLKNVGKIIQGSDIYDATNNIFKNAMDDLRTGNLINKSRENAVMDDVFGGGSDFDFDIDAGFDNAFDSGDSSSDESMAGFENVARVSVKNANQISDTVKSSTGAMVSTVVQNQRDIANHQFMISQAHFNETMGRMEGINNTLVDVGNLIKNQLDNLINPSIQFYTDAMGKLEEIAGYSKEMAAYQKNLYDAKNKELQAVEFKEDPMSEMFGANGGLDITRYAKVVMNNMEKEFNNQSMGMFDMFGGPTGFLRMLSASPLSFIPNTLVQLMIPMTFTKAISRFDKSLSGFFSSLVSKFTEWQDSQSPLLRMLGKVLGVKAKDNESVDLGQYNVELGSLDKMTHRTINTVIPTYLRQMVDLLGGKAKVFDHTTGTFNDLERMRKNYNDSLERATLSGVGDIKDSIDKRLDMLLENVKDAKQVKRAKDDAKEILKKMVSRGNMYSNFGKMNYEDFENTMGSVNLQGGEQSFKLFASVFNSLPKEVQLQLAGAINESRISKRNIQQSMIRDMYTKGFNSLFDGSSEDKYTTNIDGKVKLSPLAQGVQDKFFVNAVDYLRDIKGILLRGIKVFTMSGNGKGRNASTLSIIEDEYKKFRDAKTSTQRNREQEEKNENKANERRQREINKRIEKNGGTAYDDISDLKVTNNTASIIQERIKKQEEEERKAAEEGSIMYQMFGDTLIYTQVKNVKKKFEDLASKPFSFLVKVVDKASDMMHQVIFGKDPNAEKGEGLLKTLKKAFDENWRKLTDWLKGKLFNPIKEFFFGNDEKDGLLAKINNSVFTPLMSSVSAMMGIDLGDLDLGSYEGKKEMRARMKVKVGEYYNKWGVGKALKGAGIGGAAGLFLGSPLLGSVMGASVGFLSKSDSFMKFLFGDLDENGERMGGIISKDLGKQLKTKSTELGLGAGIGALLSTGIASFIPGLGLLGTLFTPFGAIGGALTGFGLTLAGTSDKFKNWLLGDIDEKGERTGGIISKSLANNLGKTILKGGIGGVAGSLLGGKIGALLGLGMSFIPGLGLLGNIMGPAGAIGGALMGMGLGIASSTDSFQTMLFGEKNADGVRDKGGLFDKQFRDKFVKIAPKAGISALIGGLTMGKFFGLIGAGMSFVPGLGIFGSLMGPAGIIGGSLLGLGLSITSSGQEFKDRLLGKVKGKEGEKSVFDKMEDFIGKNILNPMKDWANKTAISIKGFFEESISVPFKAALVPLRHEFQLMTESMKDLFKSAWQSTTDAIGKIFEDHVGKPFGEVMEEKVLKPLKSWIGKLVGGIGKFFGGIIAAPVKALTSISQGLYSDHVRKGVGDYGDELGSQRGEYERKVSLGDRFAGTIRKFMKSGSFNDSFNYGKEQAKGLGKGIGNYFGQKGKKARDRYKKMVEGLGDATMSATLSSLDLFGDAFGKFADFLGRMSDKFNTDLDNKEKKDKSKDTDKEPTVDDLQEEVVKAQATIFAGYNGGPNESIKETVKNIRKMNKDRGHKAGLNNKGGWQKQPKDSSGDNPPSGGKKESDRKSSKYKNIPLDTLQRTAYGKLIDNIDPIKDDINNIKKNVDGQLDGVGDNINRIRKMLAQAFDDVGGSHDGNKQRKSLFSKMIDFISSPFKFIGKMITTAVTAPIKILSSVVQGLVTTAIEGVKTVSSLARTAISTIGSIAKASMGLVSGVLKGFGHMLAGAGRVVGSALEFVGKTAFSAAGLIRDTFIEGLKLAGSAVKTFGSAMISAAGIVLDGVTGMAKLAWKGIKGIGKLGIGLTKGAFNLVTGNLFKKGLTGGSGKDVNILGGIIDNIKDITFFDNFTIKTGTHKSALRVVVDNFEDAPGGVNDKEGTTAADGDVDTMSKSIMDRSRKKNKLKEEEKKEEDEAKDQAEGKPHKGKGKGLLSRVTMPWDLKSMGPQQQSPVPNIGIPGIPMLGWNGVSSPAKGDSRGFGSSSLFPMIGWNGKKTEKKDTTSASARLGMKETALAKQRTAEVATDISEMSSALVAAKDKKMDAIRVRLVEGKDEKGGGIISTITKYLPQAGLLLTGIAAALEYIKNLIPKAKRKDLGTDNQRAVKAAVDVAVKQPGIKKTILKTADIIDNIADNPKIITESAPGKFIKKTFNRLKDSKLGKGVADYMTDQVDTVKSAVKNVLDITDEKNVLKLTKESIQEFFEGIAEKLDKIPVMKKTISKLASAIRKIAPAFMGVLEKIPKFMGDIMASCTAKGLLTTTAKTVATGLRFLAKKFFPVMAFIEGYTQTEIMNETGTSTTIEKLIGGFTMALLDCIQGALMASGIGFFPALVLTGLEAASPYWLPQFTGLLLSAIDSLFGTNMRQDYDERRNKVEAEYKAFSKDQLNKIVDEEYAKAQKEQGYSKSRDEFAKEHEKELADKLTSKTDYIKQQYGDKASYFSLFEKSTWKNITEPVTDILGAPIKYIGDKYNDAKTALYDKTKAIKDKITGTVTDIPNLIKTKGWDYAKKGFDIFTGKYAAEKTIEYGKKAYEKGKEYFTSDEFKDKAGKTWNYLKKGANIVSGKYFVDKTLEKGKEFLNKHKIPEKIMGYLGDIKGALIDTYNSTKESIKEVYKSTQEFIMKGFTTVKDSIVNTFNSAKDAITKAVGNVKDAIVGSFKSAKDYLTKSFTNLKDSFVEGITSIPEKFSEIFDKFKTNLFDKFKPIINFKETFVQAIEGSFKTMMEHPMSPFKIMNDFFKKVETFFFGTEENPTTLGVVRNTVQKGANAIKDGIISLLPSWAKPTGRGETAPANAKDEKPAPTMQKKPEEPKKGFKETLMSYVPSWLKPSKKPKTDDPKTVSDAVKPAEEAKTDAKSPVATTPTVNANTPDKKIPMPNYQVFSQNDSRWGNMPFNTGTLREKFSRAGCAPTVMATLLNTFAGKNTDPGKEAEMALKYAGEKGGIQLDYFKKYGEANGLHMGDLLTFNGDFVLDENLDPKGKMTKSLQGQYTMKAIQHLKNNKPLVGLIEDGRAKHYVIATHMDKKGMIHLIDPSDGKKYSIEANKFFKGVQYGYLLDPNEKTTDFEGGFFKQLKDKGLNIGSAFVRAVTNLITKGIFSYDDLSLESINNASAYGDVSSVKGVVGPNFRGKPKITKEQTTQLVREFMKSAPLDSKTLEEFKIGEEPFNLGGFKIGPETIIENGQIVQYPEAAVVGRTNDGRPIFYAGTPSGNELYLRYKYNANPLQYAKIMAPYAKEAERRTNLRADLSMAQSGHETGWGSNMKGNIAFNMKYSPWQNSAPLLTGTMEGANNDQYRVAAFATFPSMTDSWINHRQLLTGERVGSYKGYLELQHSDPMAAIDKLKDFAGHDKYVGLVKNSFNKYGAQFRQILDMPDAGDQKAAEDAKARKEALEKENNPLAPADGELANEATGKGIRLGGLTGKLLRPLNRRLNNTINKATNALGDKLNTGIRSITKPMLGKANGWLGSLSNTLNTKIGSGMESLSKSSPRLAKFLQETGLVNMPGELFKAVSSPLMGTLNSFGNIDAKRLINSGINAFAFGDEQIRNLKDETLRNIYRTASNGFGRAMNKVEDMPAKMINNMGDKVAQSISNMDVINSGQGNQIVELLEKLVNSNNDLTQAINKATGEKSNVNNTVNKGGNVTLIQNGSPQGQTPNISVGSLYEKLRSVTS